MNEHEQNPNMFELVRDTEHEHTEQHPIGVFVCSGVRSILKNILIIPVIRQGNKQLNKPKVINLLTDVIPADTVYIGRGSPWGNVFKVGKDGIESEVAQKYINWLQKQPELIADAKQELKGKHLACFCNPGLCHGDLLLILSNDESFDINDMDSIFKLIKQRNNNGI